MPVTIHDVANRLNPSIATVSRYLDGYPDVTQATRQRVMQVAYQANLSTGDSLALTSFKRLQDSIHSQPMLTSIDQPICDITHQLVRFLLTEIHAESLLDRPVQIQPVLRIHHSTIQGGQA